MFKWSNWNAIFSSFTGKLTNEYSRNIFQIFSRIFWIYFKYSLDYFKHIFKISAILNMCSKNSCFICVLRRPVCSLITLNLAVSAWQTVFTACAMHNTHTHTHLLACMCICALNWPCDMWLVSTLNMRTESMRLIGFDQSRRTMPTACIYCACVCVEQLQHLLICVGWCRTTNKRNNFISELRGRCRVVPLAVCRLIDWLWSSVRCCWLTPPNPRPPLASWLHSALCVGGGCCCCLLIIAQL